MSYDNTTSRAWGAFQDVQIHSLGHHLWRVAGTYTLLATHFAELHSLAKMYPEVKSSTFAAVTDEGRLSQTWKLEANDKERLQYGLLLAASVGIMESVRRGLQRSSILRFAPLYVSSLRTTSS